MNTPVCPYCNAPLEKAPKRKSKCPHCGNYIFARSKQKLFPSTLLTEEQARAVDYVKNLEIYGITERDYENVRIDLTKKFGHNANPHDVIWSLLHKVSQLLVRKHEFHAVSSIYYLKALFLNEEGKDSYNQRREAIRWDLQYNIESMKQVGLKMRKATVLAAGNSCDACKALDGKTFTPEEALEQMPIPCGSCTYILNKSPNGFCRCEYLYG